jgi:hypothetical protein
MQHPCLLWCTPVVKHLDGFSPLALHCGA